MEYQTERGTLIDRAHAIIVEDQESQTEAVGVMKLLDDYCRRVHDRLDPMVSDANKVHKGLTKLRAELIDPADGAIRHVKTCLGVYERELEEAHQAELAKAQAEARAAAEKQRAAEVASLKAQKRADEAVALAATPVVAAPVVVPETPKSTDYSRRTSWVAVIEHPELVPREWCVPDEKRINAMARSMGPELHIAGVRIEERDTVAIRR